MKFRPGQKVACIASEAERDFARTFLAMLGVNGLVPYTGQVVTVATAFLAGAIDVITLVEEPGEVLYAARYFRPVVEPEADISVFAEILDGVNRREAAPAPARVLETAGAAGGTVSRPRGARSSPGECEAFGHPGECAAFGRPGECAAFGRPGEGEAFGHIALRGPPSPAKGEGSGAFDCVAGVFA